MRPSVGLKVYEVLYKVAFRSLRMSFDLITGMWIEDSDRIKNALLASYAEKARPSKNSFAKEIELGEKAAKVAQVMSQSVMLSFTREVACLRRNGTCSVLETLESRKGK